MIDRNLLAIIPARKGSKGINKKNTYPILGKPLIQYTIDAATKSKHIKSVVVTTDDQEILEMVQSQDVIGYRRKKELCGDKSSSIEVVTDIVEKYRHFDDLILLQPTSPLRKSTHIDEAYEKYLLENSETLISVQNVNNECLKYLIEENENLKGLIDNKMTYMPRQELPSVFKPNGAIYIANIKKFIETPNFLAKKTTKYIMSEADSLDIDEYKDIDKLKEILRSDK